MLEDNDNYEDIEEEEEVFPRPEPENKPPPDVALAIEHNVGRLKKLHLQQTNLATQLFVEKLWLLRTLIKDSLKDNFEKRKNLLIDRSGCVLAETFWKNVLKGALSNEELVKEGDQKPLEYLEDIRVFYPNPREHHFEIQFYFRENPYFGNLVLTKTYYLRGPLFKPRAPGGQVNTLMYHSAGCKINWKPGKDLTKSEDGSFFNYFNLEDITLSELDDHMIGLKFQQTILPRAFYFYENEVFGGSIGDGDEEEEESQDLKRKQDDLSETEDGRNPKSLRIN